MVPERTELPGQTRSTLTLTNLQPSQLGDYTLRASNALGSVTSHAVTLDDWMAPPHLLSYPCNQSTRAGGTATFTVQAESRRGLPLFYQWQIEDTDLPGKTDAILVLTNVQTNDAGLYRIIVSNAVGTASASAMLCVGNVFSTDTNNSSGGITVPGDLANTVAISAGPPSLALQANGIVLAWGSQNSSALDVPAGLRAVSISSSGDYGLAIDRNNTLNGWGNLPYGTPTGLQPVAAVSAGERCGIALMTNGMVSIWQEPTLWPPGDPPAVPPGCTNIVAVAAGANHWLALRRDGVVFAWGDDWYGQVDIPPNLQDVVAIGASAFDSLALTAGGSVVSWGSFGLTSVPPGLSNIVAISAGRDGNLALRSDGSVFQWRSPVMGSPTSNWLTVSNAISVSAGAANGLVLLGDGAPHITVQPWDNSIRAFTSHTFFAKAVGVQPLHYQWLFNGATIPGATQESLRINSPTLSDAGAYTLLVSNSLGSVPSRSASLTVILPAEPLFIPGSAVRNSDGSFGFGISTQSGTRLEIQVSSNLVNWIHLSTFRCLSDTVYFTDPSSGSWSRFYRAHVVQ